MGRHTDLPAAYRHKRHCQVQSCTAGIKLEETVLLVTDLEYVDLVESGVGIGPDPVQVRERPA